MADMGVICLPFFRFVLVCLTGLLSTLATGAVSIEGSIFYIMSFSYTCLTQNYSAKQCPRTHTY